MTPLQFEQLYGESWKELESALTILRGGSKSKRDTVAGARVAELYRRSCEHLALARARAYPAYLVDRLDRMTAEAHQLIYRRSDLGLGRLYRLLARDIPRAVRAHHGYVWVATAVFLLPMLILGVLVYFQPELVLSVMDPEQVASFEAMYTPDSAAIGRVRGADTDWVMFGIYIRNNIGIAFQCFAGGLLIGVGSLFFLAINGCLIGAVAGYLTERGLSSTFYSFVATHGAFELTAIVLAGAAGIRLGHTLLAPGRYTRVDALVRAARECIVIVYGAAIFLVVAAGIEAFWSSSALLPNWVKYTSAAVCWVTVISYFSLQGRGES